MHIHILINKLINIILTCSPRFSAVHNYTKPNDERGLGLMARAAEHVMKEHKDIVLAYGQSDEFSFVFKKNTTSYNRRAR